MESDYRDNFGFTHFVRYEVGYGRLALVTSIPIRLFAAKQDGEVQGWLSQQQPHVVAPVLVDRPLQRRIRVGLVDVTASINQQVEDFRCTEASTMSHDVICVRVRAQGQQPANSVDLFVEHVVSFRVGWTPDGGFETPVWYSYGMVLDWEEGRRRRER